MTLQDDQNYLPDRTLSALACTEQAQICNGASDLDLGPTCTPLESLGDLLLYTKEDFQKYLTNDHQIAIAMALAYATFQSSVYSTISSLATPLLADQLCDATRSLPIANNQWEIESLNWFSIGLVSLQQTIVGYTGGPPDQYSSWAVQNLSDNDAGLNWLCQSQIVRRTGYNNFSTLAIFLIIGFGMIIICSSLWLETIVGWIRYRYARLEKGRWKQRAWWAEGTLQLQRRVFEDEMGIKEWDSEDWDKLPVTSSGKVWSVLPEWNMTPVIQGQEANDEAEEVRTPPSGSEVLIDGNAIRAEIFKEKPVWVHDIKRVRSKSF